MKPNKIVSALLGTLHFSKVVICTMLFILIIYASVVLFMFYQTGLEPVELTQGLFTTLKIEFGLTALVTVAKLLTSIFVGKQEPESEETDENTEMTKHRAE